MRWGGDAFGLWRRVGLGVLLGVSVPPPFVQEPPTVPSMPVPPRVGGGSGAAYLHRLGDG